MRRFRLIAVFLVFLVATGVPLPVASSAPPKPQPEYKSPACVACSPDGKFVYVTNQTANSISVIDANSKQVTKEIPVGKYPTGITVSPDGKTVFVANTRDHSISYVEPAGAKAIAAVACGFEPNGLCLSPDGKTLYSANFISGDVSVVDVAQRKEVARIPVVRAPTFMAITPDGKTILVSNFFSDQPATNTKLTAVISVIDTASRKVVGEKCSPGTMLMGQGIAISTDGKYAYAVHHRPNFNITPSQLQQGWIHTNALTIIPLQDPNEKIVTVLLDNVNSGAANPFGVAISKDGGTLFVTNRGIHKLSVINLPRLHELIKNTPPERLAYAHVNLGFLWGRDGVIKRVDCGGLGPKGVAVSPSDGTVYVANYFSDTVTALDPKTCLVKAEIRVGPPVEMTVERKGEFLFNSALHCFQNWLSCTSCHPDEVRADGVNWDLLNDGMTNPKNAKSLVWSNRTPPVMALGVRATMEVAVEKGFTVIQFAQPTREEMDAVSAYLRSVKPIPSPWHRNTDGSPDEAAKRGQKVFVKAGCNVCHPPPLYTNLQMFDVGTHGERDFKDHMKFDTPTILEMYRTAPYLHDGRAATLEEVLTKYNKDDLHGKTSNLSKQEIDDLVAFLMTL
ncbi:MAG: beta-propeller fold lactonase family protein [Planctomycetota bacterium]